MIYSIMDKLGTFENWHNYILKLNIKFMYNKNNMSFVVKKWFY